MEIFKLKNVCNLKCMYMLAKCLLSEKILYFKNLGVNRM